MTLLRPFVVNTVPQQMTLRCRMVPAAAAGQSNLAISKESGINPKTIATWRDRFVEAGPEGLVGD
jgi:hypothetical protein